MDLSKFYSQFREETAENVRILSDGLLELENMSSQNDPAAQAHIHAIFRAMHTIKGSARLLGFERVGQLAHTMENVLGAVRAGQRMIDRPLADELLRGGDAILELTAAAIDGGTVTADVNHIMAMLDGTPLDVESLAHAEADVSHEDADTNASPDDVSHEDADTNALPDDVSHMVATTPPQAATTDATPPMLPFRGSASGPRANNHQTVRVRVDRLDRLINLTGELVVGQQIVTTHAQTLDRLNQLVSQQERALIELDAELRRLRFSANQRQMLDEHISTLFNCSNQARQIVSGQVDTFSRHVNQQGVLIGDLEQEVMAARLLPISTVFGSMPRAVRELARSTNKEVQLEIHGETTEMDRKLLELLNDPLLHLVRNAVDHGIETPDQRIAQGKSREGRIRLVAEADGGEVRVSIADDGHGMHPDTLRDIGVRKGLISAENAVLLSDNEALELIFLPGFSSSQIITDISGRGVGMDVVRSNIGELGGQVLIDSQPDQGTCITLILPLTLVTTRILLVTVGKHMFCLPASGCRGTIWVSREHIHTIEGRATIVHKAQTIPLLRLADLLGVEAAPAFHQRPRMPVVLVGSAQRPLGLLVDQLFDEREAVVKSLGPLFEHRRRYSGAVQLGDGQLVLLLNPVDISQTARGMAMSGLSRSLRGSRQRFHLLIADDSFTTRELIRSILQSAGYIVTAAFDGQDALDRLRIQTYDLVISDVEMPRLNGFQLTSRIRQELGLRDLPVIIITSLASDEHRRQGLEAGAQAYIVKSQFNQDNLLEVVQQLLGYD